jgi:hypothetical protein
MFCLFGFIASDPVPANSLDDEELAGKIQVRLG